MKHAWDKLRNAHTIVVGKLEGKRPPVRFRHRRKAVCLLKFSLEMWGARVWSRD
jgi:hypothetical protein